MVTPLAFALALRVTRARWLKLLQALWPGVTAALVSAWLVHFVRLSSADLDPLHRLPLLALVYSMAFVTTVALFRGRQLRGELRTIYGDMRRPAD